MNTRLSIIVIRLLVIGGFLAGLARHTQSVLIAAEGVTPLPAGLQANSTSPGGEDIAAGANIPHIDRLREFEAVMDRYYRHQPLETARKKLTDKIEQYNEWAEAAHEKKKTSIAALNNQVDSLRALDKLTNEMDKKLEQKPDLSDKASVEAYNALVEERNKRVREYNELAQVHKKDKGAYEAANEQFETEAASRKAELETGKQEYESEVDAHRKWFQSGDDLELFKNVNRLFAESCDDARNNEAVEPPGLLEKTRTIRRELFEHTVETHDRMETGAVVVEARLCRRESCFLLVDTGAMTVTIPMSLVEALGLTNQLGDEISVAVAGGGRVKGREITIPQLAVQGHELENVRAIVLDEFDVGVDGLLGLSYLKQFAIRIDPKHANKLVIEPRREKRDLQ